MRRQVATVLPPAQSRYLGRKVQAGLRKCLQPILGADALGLEVRRSKFRHHHETWISAMIRRMPDSTRSSAPSASIFTTSIREPGGLMSSRHTVATSIVSLGRRSAPINVPSCPLVPRANSPTPVVASAAPQALARSLRDCWRQSCAGVPQRCGEQARAHRLSQAGLQPWPWGPSACRHARQRR